MMGGAAHAAALRDTFDIAMRLLTYNAFHNLSYEQPCAICAHFPSVSFSCTVSIFSRTLRINH